MGQTGKCVIHWFRRDLRIADNTALHRACHGGLPIVPVYVLSKWTGHHPWTGANRQQFLCDALATLAEDLRAISGRLVIRQGDAEASLEELIQESGAVALHFNEVPDPFGKSEEKAIRALCIRLGIECHGHHDVSLHNPTQVLTLSGSPYKVFTPYCRNWLTLDKPAPVPAAKDLNTPESIHSLDLPDISLWELKNPAAGIAEAGEAAATTRMNRFLEKMISGYGETRDFPAEDGTSRLSQDLRFGLISIRTLYAELIKVGEDAKPAARKNIEIYLKELAWREFYFAILHHFPEVLHLEFNPDWRGLPWDEPDARFEAWKHGQTGFPIVDAGMRELQATGFMHNRVRMIVAMFLTKDLHLDWRLGESWFMEQLVDGEIASNNGGWQWSAGTGADAAPYFRIQNPWTQTARYDPQAVYIKRWVPELKNVSAKLLMAPPKDGMPIAKGYPLPIVDHSAERNRTLEIFKRH